MLFLIQIVPTEYRYLSKAALPTNQFSVTEYFIPLREVERSWPGWYSNSHVETIYIYFLILCNITFLVFHDTAVYFLYDLSPITVTIKEERRSFLHFITRLCAVLGGTFALTGPCLNLISNISRACSSFDT